MFDLAFRLDVLYRPDEPKGDLMLKNKKFHYGGLDETGGGLFFECSKEPDEATVVRMEQAKPGQPLRLGQKLCHIKPDGDGEHVQIEEVTGAGPPMVSTDSYRAGWDRIFGSNFIN